MEAVITSRAAAHPELPKVERLLALAEEAEKRGVTLAFLGD